MHKIHNYMGEIRGAVKEDYTYIGGGSLGRVSANNNSSFDT